jgi:hypothetical protein
MCLCLRFDRGDNMQNISRFFATLWDDYGRLTPERHVEIFQAMRNPSVPTKYTNNIPIKLLPEEKFSLPNPRSANYRENQRNQERIFVEWLEDLSDVHFAGKPFKEWRYTQVATKKNNLFGAASPASWIITTPRTTTTVATSLSP